MEAASKHSEREIAPVEPTSARAALRVKKARTPELARGSSAAEAFQAIARSCLAHLLANVPVLQATHDPEAVHQMRVAVRRLRAALSLFRDVAADDEIPRLKDELRWFAGRLGEARDLDVFIAGTVTPARKTEPGDKGLAALGAAYVRRRAAAYERALEAAGSERFRTLVADVTNWIERGPWLKQGGKAVARREEAVEDFAAGELSRRRKRVLKRGAHLAQLEPLARHALRIAVKKLRYAAEFFAPLYAGQGRRKRGKAFRATLAELQERLGALNDLAVAGQITKGLQGPAAGAARRLAEGRRARLDEELAAAVEAHDALAKAEPFWR